MAGARNRQLCLRRRPPPLLTHFLQNEYIRRNVTHRNGALYSFRRIAHCAMWLRCQKTLPLRAPCVVAPGENIQGSACRCTLCAKVCARPRIYRRSSMSQWFGMLPVRRARLTVPAPSGPPGRHAGMTSLTGARCCPVGLIAQIEGSFQLCKPKRVRRHGAWLQRLPAAVLPDG